MASSPIRDHASHGNKPSQNGLHFYQATGYPTTISIEGYSTTLASVTCHYIAGGDDTYNICIYLRPHTTGHPGLI